MKARGWIGGLLAVGLAWSGLATAQDRTVDVGGRPIVVPVEKGYELISDQPVFMDMLAKFLPPGLRLLAVSMHKEDIESELMAAEKHPYYFYAVPVNVQSMDLEDATWIVARPMIEAQLKTLDLDALAKPMLDKGSKALSDQLGAKVDISGELSEKQVVWVAPDGSVRMTAVMPSRMQLANQKGEYLQDAGIAILPVRKRMLAVYAYRSRGEGEKGSDAIRAVLDTALQAFQRANAAPAAPAASVPAPPAPPPAPPVGKR